MEVRWEGDDDCDDNCSEEDEGEYDVDDTMTTGNEGEDTKGRGQEDAHNKDGDDEVRACTKTSGDPLRVGPRQKHKEAVLGLTTRKNKYIDDLTMLPLPEKLRKAARKKDI